MGPVLAKIAPQVAHRALGRHRTGKDRHAADIGEGGAGCKSAVACGHVPAPFLRFQTSASRKWTVSTLVELRSEGHTSELQSLMRISYAVFCLKKQKQYDKLQSYTRNIDVLDEDEKKY